MEFVETQQAGILGDDPGGGPDRIVALGFAKQRLAFGHAAFAPFADQSVHLRHKVMEVYAPLTGHGCGGKEQVHQHGFAAPDWAVEIDATHGLGLAEQPGFSGPGQVALQPDQGLQGLGLGWIGSQSPGSDGGVIGFAQGGSHCGSG